MKKTISLSILAMLTIATAVFAKQHAIGSRVMSAGEDGKIQVTRESIRAISPVDLNETAERFHDIMQDRGMRVFRFNDRAGQEKIEMHVLPGELLIYGSYRRARSITRCSMDVLDDLPDTVVIEKHGIGQVTVTASNPGILGERDGGNCSEVLAMLSDAMQEIVSETTRG